jgi:F-type H+-transporting ATPase subunit gamma
MMVPFLPIGAITTLKLEGVESDEELAAQSTLFDFEPNAEAVLGYMLPRFLNILMYQVLLGAKASEQSARMVSMKNATDSAINLIKDLTLEYNKRRQSSITTELLDIAGGQANAN